MDIKSQIAPKGLEFKSSEFIISDKYATILTAISYPKAVPIGYLSNLTSMSGIKVVIKHIPLPFSVITKMLNKEIADLKQRYQTENDKTIQEIVNLGPIEAKISQEKLTTIANKLILKRTSQKYRE